MTGLELRNVQLRLKGRNLFAPLSLRVAPGEIVSVIGPSGSGKSSLLAHLCGVLARDFEASGEVLLEGESLLGKPPQKRGVGILFQDDLLFPHLSVGGNLAFGLRAGSGSRAARQVIIDAALASVELSGFAERDPATLSGGQRARVALLRVLLSEPRAVLLDEPFGKLDAALRDNIRHLVFERCRQSSLPVLLVTHDPADVAAAGGAVLELCAADGSA